MSERTGKPTPPDASWQPRNVNAAGDVARYSKFVGYMRIGLPAVAVILVLLVFVLPYFMGNDERFRVGTVTTPLTEAAVDALSMVNARYFGTDKKGQPYSLTAKGVKERGEGDKRIELTAPQADITLTGGEWLSITAGSGLYDRDSETLDLTDNVSLFQDKGYEMHTSAANIRLKDSSASGRTAVQSQGPFGQLDAQGFDLFDKGERVLFLGPAKLVLTQAIKSDGAANNAAPASTKN
ncbi:MAG: LPS export ABC transporter periplasmic protein LptC [Rhodospirillaceae bacterium]|nr:LPS export ABC transporter periplasmic protein LptC [Rhodospirillaceae bacterium]